MGLGAENPAGSLHLSHGSVLAGRYRLERPLGEGGMGVVWEARQLPTDKAVAVKILKERDPGDAARFLREARMAASLSHRNVVQVFDFCEVPAENLTFLVMELLRGETLAERLVRNGRLSVSESAEIMLSVLHAVRAAHSQGMVHRDLKPENVFIAAESDGSTTIKVLDFGLAKPVVTQTNVTNVTQTGSVIGTPFYMAPEQVYGERDVDGRADIWALGVILYQCLSGLKPFDGDNFGQVFRRISSGEMRPIAELAPVPESIARLIDRMLTHDRDRRLADLNEAVVALAPLVQQGSPTVALPPLVQNPYTVRLPSSSPPPSMSHAQAWSPPVAPPAAPPYSAASQAPTVTVAASSIRTQGAKGSGKAPLIAVAAAGLAVIAIGGVFAVMSFPRRQFELAPADPLAPVSMPAASPTSPSPSAAPPTPAAPTATSQPAASAPREADVPPSPIASARTPVEGPSVHGVATATPKAAPPKVKPAGKVDPLAGPRF